MPVPDTLLNVCIESEAVYSFLKPLNKKTDGFTMHETIMECTVSSSMAMVCWWRGDKRISVRRTLTSSIIYLL
jgi:hypothetical protein